MKAIRVNADYEMALFEQKSAPRIVNESLEFLAFYLEDRPLYTSKHYSHEYLNHIEKVTGNYPRIISSGDYENWWGTLQNIPKEQLLNSKEFSSTLSHDSKVITSINELDLIIEKRYLAKNPYGMSGQNFKVFQKGQESEISALLSKWGKLIVEPLYERVHDFSHYVLNERKTICYQNLVDENFQYKGTIFRNLSAPDLRSLSFYQEIDAEEWKRFDSSFSVIKSAMRSEGVEGGYSIDSFTYKDQTALKIRPISEINYRKTMGLVAWLISSKYGSNSWNMFVLGKNVPFKKVQEKISGLSGVIHLSPGDTRFEIFHLSADTETDGLGLYNELKRLLPDCKFSI